MLYDEIYKWCYSSNYHNIVVLLVAGSSITLKHMIELKNFSIFKTINRSTCENRFNIIIKLLKYYK